MGVNAAGAQCWQPSHFPVPLSWNLGILTSWNPLGHSRPGTGLLYLYLNSKGNCSHLKIIQKIPEQRNGKGPQ